MKEHWAAAWSGYAAGLAKFPSSLALRERAGILALGLHRFQDAAGLLAPVFAVAGSYEVKYSYGAALAMLGRDQEAREVLARISPAATFAVPAAMQLTLLAARAKNDNAALGCAEAAALAGRRPHPSRGHRSRSVASCRPKRRGFQTTRGLAAAGSCRQHAAL